ncbi:MAG TPA: hypothetical protein VFS00_29405 [Polyangiaceae bacterium]|nr:hypothetical protein [Polyangiaceae bacterium]
MHAVRFADEPEFVHHVARLRASAFDQGGPWNYGFDAQDRHAVQMVAFEGAEPVGALRLCLGDELIARGGLDSLYLNTGWHFDPRAEAFFDTAVEYGRFWTVRGHPRAPAVVGALWAALDAFIKANPKYRSLCGTVALLDHGPASQQLVVDYLRRYHLPEARIVHPRRPLAAAAVAPAPGEAAPNETAPGEAAAGASSSLESTTGVLAPRDSTTSGLGPPAGPAPERAKAFRALMRRLREVDPEHPLPALLFLYLRQGAQLLGDVAFDETGRKLLIPLYANVSTLQGFVVRMRSNASSDSTPPLALGADG